MLIRLYIKMKNLLNYGKYFLFPTDDKKLTRPLHRQLLIIFFLIGWIFEVFASSSSQVALSVATLNVENDQSQRQLISNAMQQVLVKIVGSQKVLKAPFAPRMVSSAQTYLKSYRYTEKEGERLFVAEFDQEKLVKTLIDEGQSIWGNPRPDTLLWLVVEEDYQRHIVTEEYKGNTLSSMLRVAEKRGLPLSLPLMDLNDAERITSADIWGRFVYSLRTASERYGAENILIARLFRSDPEQALWRIDWTHIHNDVVTSGEHNVISREAVIKEWINAYADKLGESYAVIPRTNDDNQISITVSIANINSLAQIVAVEKYLLAMGSVQSTRLSQVKGSIATFDVTLLGNESDWQNLITLQQRLIPINDNTDELATVLPYYWNG